LLPFDRWQYFNTSFFGEKAEKSGKMFHARKHFCSSAVMKESVIFRLI